MSFSSKLLASARRDRRGSHHLAVLIAAIALGTFSGAGSSAAQADGTGNAGVDAVHSSVDPVSAGADAVSIDGDAVSVTAGGKGAEGAGVSVTAGGLDPIASALGSGSSGDGQAAAPPRPDDPTRPSHPGSPPAPTPTAAPAAPAAPSAGSPFFPTADASDPADRADRAAAPRGRAFGLGFGAPADGIAPPAPRRTLDPRTDTGLTRSGSGYGALLAPADTGEVSLSVHSVDGDLHVTMNGRRVPADWITRDGSRVTVSDARGRTVATFIVTADGHVTIPSGWSFSGKASWASRTSSRKVIGIRTGTVAPALAEHLGLSGEQGILVEQVIDGYPAARAGVRDHDVIVAVDGVRPATLETLRERLGSASDDDRLELTIVRKGNTLTIPCGVRATVGTSSSAPRIPTGRYLMGVDREGAPTIYWDPRSSRTEDGDTPQPQGWRTLRGSDGSTRPDPVFPRRTETAPTPSTDAPATDPWFGERVPDFLDPEHARIDPETGGVLLIHRDPMAPGEPAATDSNSQSAIPVLGDLPLLRENFRLAASPERRRTSDELERQAAELEERLDRLEKLLERLLEMQEKRESRDEGLAPPRGDRRTTAASHDPERSVSPLSDVPVRLSGEKSIPLLRDLPIVRETVSGD